MGNGYSVRDPPPPVARRDVTTPPVAESPAERYGNTGTLLIIIVTLCSVIHYNTKLSENRLTAPMAEESNIIHLESWNV